METFCTKQLQLNDQFSAQFLLDFWKRNRPPVQYTYISFLNVPSEAEEDAMTRFVEQYATIGGNPGYPLKKLDNIEYLTVTRVYRVIRITQHIPHLISLFGRQITYIYDGQPDHQPKYTRQQQSDSDKSDAESINDDQSNTESDTEHDTVKQTNTKNDSESQKETGSNQHNESSGQNTNKNNFLNKKTY